MPLGPARDRDAVAAVAPENLQDLLRLRPAQQFLKPRDVFETQFQGLQRSSASRRFVLPCIQSRCC